MTNVVAVAYAPQYMEQGGETRAAFPPSGYVSYSSFNYSGLPLNDVDASIGIFFTKNGEEPLASRFAKGSDDKWRMMVEIDHDDYYAYGFLPSGAVESSSITSADYSSGATLNLNGLSTVSAQDVCVTIGVKDGISETEVEDFAIGHFATTIRDSHNYIFLVFDHLYSGMRFRFKINSTYFGLRTIKINGVRLRAYNGDTQIQSKVNAAITLTKNDTGDMPITNIAYSPAGGSTDAEIPIFAAGGDVEPITLSPTVYSDFVGMFLPATATRFELETHYDVYDKLGHLIRANQSAINNISTSRLFGEVTTRGHVYTLNITVNPTYLYVLADPDLDNPSFEIITNS